MKKSKIKTEAHSNDGLKQWFNKNVRKIKITLANSNDKLKQWLNKSQQTIIINEQMINQVNDMTKQIMKYWNNELISLSRSKVTPDETPNSIKATWWNWSQSTPVKTKKMRH